jgi:nucleoside-diphosphate-sugar epimerase
VNVVFGARGMVGSFIFARLLHEGQPVVAVSRTGQNGPHWAVADLALPNTIKLPEVTTVFCAANARTFSFALPHILHARPKRVVVISSTSVFTKKTCEDLDERQSIRELAEAEGRISSLCVDAGVEWTILRPTLIYMEGRDRNVTQIAGLIRRLRFMPLYGSASGLRQPVHAEDLALGSIAAARSKAAVNRAYCTVGGETLSYREMVGRIFDGLGMTRRLITLPPLVWEAAFALTRPFYPGVTAAMGARMLKDMAFDSSPASTDFGWRARAFRPCFQATTNSRAAL